MLVLVSVTVLPDNVQLPLTVNATGKPDDALALIVNGGSPKRLLGSAPKLIVWVALRMVNVCGSHDAGLNVVVSPA